jgi:hypothetical protein
MGHLQTFAAPTNNRERVRTSAAPGRLRERAGVFDLASLRRSFGCGVKQWRLTP